MVQGYVNIHGKPVLVPEPEEAAPKPKRPASTPRSRRVDDESDASEHHGYEIVGITKKSLEEARAAHEKERAEAAKIGKPIGAFSEPAWLATQRMARAVSRKFVIRSAAEEAVAIMSKGGGWLRIEARPILKG